MSDAYFFFIYIARWKLRACSEFLCMFWKSQTSIEIALCDLPRAL